jgi:glycosyltransferase involved in cell wall biosynthesis
MRKSVLMVAYTHYASDARVVRAAEAALDAGFDVDFLALRRPGEPSVEHVRGVRVFHLNQRKYRGGGMLDYCLAYGAFLLRTACKAAALHLRRPYAVVHVNNMPDFMVFSALVPKLMRARVLLDIHDPMPETWESKFKGARRNWMHKLLLWQEQLSAWFADRVLTVHEPVKQNILLQHNLPGQPIFVVSNFPDDSMFPPRESVPCNGSIRLVFHGTILERSGLGQMLLALSRITHKDRISAKVIGEGDFSEAFALQIQHLKLEGMVEFVNASVPVNEIPAAIADCNVGIVPLEISAITNHALPLKLLEYIALGMPVVSVRNAAISHYLSDDDCMFFEPNNLDSLCAVLNRLVANPDLVQHYHQRSLAIRDRFLWSREKKKYVGLLHELCN